MSDSGKEAVKRIVDSLGGPDNILFVNNCMTRLRITVRDDSAVREKELEQDTRVLGLIHDRPGYYELVAGPGKSRKYADLCHEMYPEKTEMYSEKKRPETVLLRNEVKAGTL